MLLLKVESKKIPFIGLIPAGYYCRNIQIGPNYLLFTY